ncbi:mitochondrial fission regulator 2 isoform X2 [Nerophis ophidion]|nr:mitochondrial fission regulator 2 isoform X2 [Nerophis ophidion]
MSLLQDVLDVLRVVLEYFGVPPEMLLPVWASPLCGQYRSIVRRIGSNLPLKPTPRVYIQIPHLNSRPHGSLDVTVEAPALPSFADALNPLPLKKQKAAVGRDVRKHPKGPSRGSGRFGMKTEQEALQKITTLEGELLKLRAQIDMMIAERVPESRSTNITPPVLPVSALTSTPRCAPPPPPPCPSSYATKSSVVELIRQRKCEGKKQDKPTGLSNSNLPSMLDILKDLNQVKLRSVARSPGGTPLRPRQSKRRAATINDPAGLIAEALKRKFAHHRHNNSSDKENSLEFSPCNSPEMSGHSLLPREDKQYRYGWTDGWMDMLLVTDFYFTHQSFIIYSTVMFCVGIKVQNGSYCDGY